jgi:hypothetical protein
VSLAQILHDFNSSIAQCDSLIANAHRADAAGVPLLPSLDQQQITVAAFLNLFIAWETFLEASLMELMTGSLTTTGTAPNRFVAPMNTSAARELVTWMGRYFDYGNHQNVAKAVRLYFENGYPYEPHLSAIYSDLNDLRTMRNASAHITANTQTALESLAVRVTGSPQPGISLYQLLTMTDPRTATRGTIFLTYRDKLAVAAELIANG